MAYGDELHSREDRYFHRRHFRDVGVGDRPAEVGELRFDSSFAIVVDERRVEEEVVGEVDLLLVEDEAEVAVGD